MSEQSRFFDLPTLLRLHDAVAAMDPDGPPSLSLVHQGAGLGQPSRLGFLSGSFNPPHVAHEALAEAALAEAALDGVLLVLSKRTVDKERVSGLSLADRLLLLMLLAEKHPRFSVVLVNRGLYVDQSAIIRQAWPSLQDLWFIVGYDKIVQIFDPRYYADREAALEQLFGLSGALVAPRGQAGLADLDALLDRAENRRFAARVRPLVLPPELAEVSSSDLRVGAASGRPDLATVPDLVQDFVAATAAFSPPRRLADGESVAAYEVRTALLETLARARPWADREADFPLLLRLALGETEASRRFRAWLRKPPLGPTEADLHAFQVATR